MEPDWILIYHIDGDELQLARTGTRADVFDE
ncbi:type II toxin-antitoxin system YafQ family toxin [Alloalcanivorax xenomutans]|nr:type II toxin-antitoxin system YafQ family toxin [Alloalcanivorax xenomutans]